MNLVCNLFVSTRPPRIRVTRPSATSRRCTCPALRCSPPSGEQALGWSGTSWARIILWISLTAFMEFVSILWYYCWRLSTWDLLPKFRYTKSLDNIRLRFFGTFSLLSCWSAWPLWADQSTSATFCISSFKNSVQFVSQLTSSISFSSSRGNKMFKRFLKQQFIILLQLLQSEGAGQ